MLCMVTLRVPMLLAGDDNRAKIADFGLSKVYNPFATGTAQARGTNRGAGTMLWMSPEVYQGFERTCSDDIWSLQWLSVSYVRLCFLYPKIWRYKFC